MNPTLKDQLAKNEWTDLEEAAFFLAKCLGVMGLEVSKMADAKSVFWSKNTVGDALYQMLESLVKMGVLLESEHDSSLVKWNPSFKGSWQNN